MCPIFLSIIRDFSLDKQLLTGELPENHSKAPDFSPLILLKKGLYCMCCLEDPVMFLDIRYYSKIF